MNRTLQRQTKSSVEAEEADELISVASAARASLARSMCSLEGSF